MPGQGHQALNNCVDGQFEPLEPTQRGPERSHSDLPGALEDLVNHFQGRPGIDAVVLWAFPVEPSESPPEDY